MDLFQCMDSFKQMYPGKQITFEFDDKCHFAHYILYENGIPNPIQYVESNKVKVTVEGMNPLYCPIITHREVCTWAKMKEMINSKPKPTVEIDESQIPSIKPMSPELLSMLPQIATVGV